MRLMCDDVIYKTSSDETKFWFAIATCRGDDTVTTWQVIHMESRRIEQMLKAMDEERDGKHRKLEEFPNTISVGALMDDAAAAASRIDIAGVRA